MLQNPILFAGTFALLLHGSLAAQAQSVIKTVIVVAMENTDAKEIYGNTAQASYINGTLMPIAARASNFNDPFQDLNVPSEPHYIWMEAGTNAFADHTFTTNRDALTSKKNGKNSTASKDHLVAQMNAASVTWMSYQEGMTPGRCPIVSFGLYAAKHNPFVFFEDVSGNPPNRKNQFCIDHHKPYSAFAADLAANAIPKYVFITPNLCNDMHGDKKCRPKGVHRIKRGDDWLRAELPRIIDWVTENSGVLFVVWDEGNATKKLPFLAIGPGVQPNHESAVAFNHGSLIKSVEEIFNLPILSAVSQNNNFKDLFKAGSYP